MRNEIDCEPFMDFLAAVGSVMIVALGSAVWWAHGMF